jgi:hypothetical protein
MKYLPAVGVEPVEGLVGLQRGVKRVGLGRVPWVSGNSAEVIHFHLGTCFITLEHF